MDLLGTSLAPIISKSSLTDHIHKSRTFEFSSSGSLLAAATATFIGDIGATPAHFMGFDLVSDAGPVTLELIEAPTVSVQGSLQASSNKNRSDVVAATTAVYSGSTVTGGTVIATRTLFGVAGGTGGGAHTEGSSTGFLTEWVLNPNTVYAIRITAGAELDFAATMIWYEADVY